MFVIAQESSCAQFFLELFLQDELLLLTKGGKVPKGVLLESEKIPLILLLEVLDPRQKEVFSN